MIKALSRWLGRFRDRARKAEKAKEPTTRLGPIDLSPSQREQVARKLAELPEDSAPMYARGSPGCRSVTGTSALPWRLVRYHCAASGWRGRLGTRRRGTGWHRGHPGRKDAESGPLPGERSAIPISTFLIPTRPADAIECSCCRGLGNIMFGIRSRDRLLLRRSRLAAAQREVLSR